MGERRQPANLRVYGTRVVLQRCVVELLSATADMTPSFEFWPLAVMAPFIGSFLGVLVTRLPESQPFVFARSACDSCEHVLSPAELIPVASWAWLRARCRHCGGHLGFFYPAIEVTALAVVLWAASITSGWALAASCLFGWTLLALALIDWRVYLLPDPLTLFLLLSGLVAAWLIDSESISNHIIGAASGFLALATLALAYKRLRGREGLGFGDAKLLAGLGAWVGWEGLPGAIFIGALAGLLFVAARSVVISKPSWTDRLPFGSFLAVAGWLTWLYGPLTFGN